MPRCINCNALVPDGVGPDAPADDFVCCQHCDGPAGCRCALGEYGVPEALSVLDGDDDEDDDDGAAAGDGELHLCDHEGCAEDAFPCYAADDAAAWFCLAHAPEHGYCAGCGQSWAATGDLDADGLCPSCAAEVDEDEWPPPVNHFTDIQGPPKCPRRCSQCPDGNHHWLTAFVHADPGDDDYEEAMNHPAVRAGHGETGWLQCKHCPSWHAVTPEMLADPDFYFA